jgi:hypothetical protein
VEIFASLGAAPASTIPGPNLSLASTTPVVPLVSLKPVANLPGDWQQICRLCQRHRWCTLSCEYLQEFSKKIKTALLGYLGARGKLVHEKNVKPKLSWHCPFFKYYFSLKRCLKT